MSEAPPRIDAEWLRRPATQAVFAALARQGYEGRVVGGAVRNALLGKPVADIDIATPATPEQVIDAATAAGLDVVPTGLQHGTVTVMSAHVPHEVTTLRRDVETDGRHAVVAFTDDWAADAGRRDFTINALYCDAHGTVHDPLGGFADLAARRVRFIGDAQARIREDFLRILRFFRFTAEYADGPIDAAGLMASSALREGMQRLSAERIRGEILKILSARRASEMIGTMYDHGFWVPLLGLAPVPAHARRLIALAPHSASLARLAALCIRTPEDALALYTRLRLSNGELEWLMHSVSPLAEIMPSLSDLEARKMMYRFGRDSYLADLDRQRARHPLLDDDPGWQRLRQLSADWESPTFPLRGRDLIANGMTPGPSVGETLRALETWWMDQDFAPDQATLLAHLAGMPSTSRT